MKFIPSEEYEKVADRYDIYSLWHLFCFQNKDFDFEKECITLFLKAGYKVNLLDVECAYKHNRPDILRIFQSLGVFTPQFISKIKDANLSISCAGIVNEIFNTKEGGEKPKIEEKKEERSDEEKKRQEEKKELCEAKEQDKKEWLEVE